MVNLTMAFYIAKKVQTRKLLTLHRGLHPQSDVDHLYVSRELGGWGLQSVEDVVIEERCSLYEYIQISTESLISEVKKAAEILYESQSLEQFRSDRSSGHLEHYIFRETIAWLL